MNQKHWTDDELIAGVYGIGPEDGHLEECAACRTRWETLVERRRQAVAAPEIAESFLAAQRARVEQRIARGRRVQPWLRAAWAGIATALVVGVFFLDHQPAEPPLVAYSDTVLLSEIHEMVMVSEPEAIAPLHALFEE